MFREVVDSAHHRLFYPWLVRGKAREDREIAHERALYWMEKAPGWLLNWMSSSFTYHDPSLRSEVLGLEFKNPLGLAAGFDKNGQALLTLASLGFGHVEVGTITKIPYQGNPRPRIFALAEDHSLINSMGFPGEGLDVSIKRFLKINLNTKIIDTIVGINIGASLPSFQENTVIADIKSAYTEVRHHAGYIVLNVSSPNTPGVRGLQEPSILDWLLSVIDEERKSEDLRLKIVPKRPFLVKLSPDLGFNQIDRVLEVMLRHRVDGVVATNTSIDPEIKDSLAGKHKDKSRYPRLKPWHFNLITNQA